MADQSFLVVRYLQIEIQSAKTAIKTQNKQVEQHKFCILLINIYSAFDTVYHDILLKKLEYDGIREVALDLFNSYLRNRPQIVTVGGITSNPLTVKCRVPQGGVLGPLLFLIYINDIHKSSEILKFHLFTNDISIFYSHEGLRNVEMTLNNELNKVSEWLIANKLTLNFSKSTFVIFHPPQKKTSKNFVLQINDEKLEEKRSTKYLGLLIDKHLTRKSQNIKRHRITSQTSTLRTQKYAKNFVLCIYPASH